MKMQKKANRQKSLLEGFVDKNFPKFANKYILKSTFGKPNFSKKNGKIPF